MTGLAHLATALPDKLPQPPFRWSEWIERRWQFGLLLSRLGLYGEAVEVGTHRGHFAAQLLRNWGGRLTCVDPWQDNMPDYVDPVAGGDRQADFLAAQQLLAEWSDRVTFLRLTSAEAAPRFADRSLDFVYVDGNHQERYVRQDLALWWPKIRPGGVLAGHDIVNAEWEDQILPPVRDLALAADLPVDVVPGDAFSWYLRRPA